MSIYKECDIRGIYGYEFTDATAYKIGRAIAYLAEKKEVLVCGDVRLSTPFLKEKLIEGLIIGGARVYDMGIAPTPVFYFTKKHFDLYAGVMVTASHNPPQYNGFKIMYGDLPVEPHDIQQLRNIIEKCNFPLLQGSVKKLTEYKNEYLRDVFMNVKKSNLKIVVDCCDGTTSPFAPRILKSLGNEITELYCGTDGNFFNRDPNPAVYENLKDLQAKVLEVGADMGVAFDGDGDRVVFVDEKGEVIQSEKSLVIFLREYLKTPSSVVYDLKSSSIVKKEAEKMGSEAIMERSGHAFIKRTFLKNNSALAGEISGHYFFKELGYDDGIYAASKMAEIVSNYNKPLSEVLSTIEKTVITKDIRIKYPINKQDELLREFENFGAQYGISKIDGVRVQTPVSWLLLRKSVTEEGVTLRIEADNMGEMMKTKALLAKAIPFFKEYLV